MKKTILIFAAFALCLAACVKDPELIQKIELGCEFKDVEVDAFAGTQEYEIVCNTECRVALQEGITWARLVTPSVFQGDSTVVVEYDENDGEERKATITLTAGHRTLELTLIQNNVLSKQFYFPHRNILIPFTTGASSAPFVSSVDSSAVSYSITYEGDEKGWIEEPVSGLINGDFVFAARENLKAARRGAIVTLSAPDAVGRIMTANLYVSQMANGEEETIPVTVAQVRDFGVEELDGDNCIRKNYVMKARVINDNSEGNGAANRNLSIIQQDQSLSSRSVYLQSLEHDGSGQYCGIQLQFATEEDNSTKRYDLIEINIKGLKFTASGEKGTDDPFRVTISGAGVVNIISCTDGSASDLPDIVRKVDELTDDDVYTYVTIPSLEIPIRKGPFCPVDLRYTNICNKYPMVTRDPAGNIMYLVSNISCAWARDGEGIPEGSGPVKGVVVHERCDNFEWDSEAAAQSPLLADYVTDMGYIGKFQIRPITKSEIGITENLDEATSALVAEWRYANSLYPDEIVQNALNDTIYPTYPVAFEPIKNPEVKGYLMYSNGKISTGQDWTHLGPVVDGKITDIPGTNGVYDALGRSIHWNPLSYCNTCGIIQGQNCSSWHGGNWFSGKHDDPRLSDYYWEIAFCTQELTAGNAPLSVNLGVSNAYGDDTGAPRYWTLAWSTDKNIWNEVYASSYAGDSFVDYTAKGDDYTYTIPDFPLVAAKKQYNLPGNKYISINLPSGADVWGKDVVYVRLYPAKDLSGNNAASGGVSYDGATILNSRRSCLNYVGIRYQK